MKIWATAALLCTISGVAIAGETIECTMSGKLRTIEVVQAAGKPCDVRYTREGETAATSVWTYAHQTDQCSANARSLAEKLKGFGWSCAPAEVAAPAEIAAPRK